MVLRPGAQASKRLPESLLRKGREAGAPWSSLPSWGGSQGSRVTLPVETVAPDTSPKAAGLRPAQPRPPAPLSAATLAGRPGLFSLLGRVAVGDVGS